jgi:hypothetical protein
MKRLLPIALLLAFYLMAPPMDKLVIHTEMPLSAWKNVDTYDTAAECRRSQLWWMEHAKGLDQSWEAKGYRAGSGTLWTLDMQCVETSDPRLAK